MKKKVVFFGFIVFGIAIVYLFYSKDKPIAKINLYYNNSHCPSLKISSLGEEKYVILDTGQSRDFGIKEANIRDFILHDTTKTDTHINIYGDTFVEPVFFMDKLNFGSWIVRALHCSKSNPPTTNHLNIHVKCKKPHKHVSTIGSIGMGVLSRYNFYINHQLEQFVVYKKGTVPKNIIHQAFFTIDFAMNDQQLPIVSFDTEYGKKRFLLDCGSPLSVLSENTQKNYAQVYSKMELDRVKLQLFYEDKPFMNKEFIFFGKNFDILNVDGILGMDVLNFYNVFFDTKRQRLYFVKI